LRRPGLLSRLPALGVETCSAGATPRPLATAVALARADYLRARALAPYRLEAPERLAELAASGASGGAP
jgi:hypothetical protein